MTHARSEKRINPVKSSNQKAFLLSASTKHTPYQTDTTKTFFQLT